MQNHQPTEIRRLSQSLSIEWKNGLHSEIPYRILREKCPCARCSAIKQEEDPFQLLPSENYWKNLHLVGIQPVGRYAVQLQWSDGHKTGIYTFSFLYELSTDTHQDVSSNNATTK